MAEAKTHSRGVRKERTGLVVSKSGDKTVVVQTERHVRHPLYGKTLVQRRKFHAHDERNEAQVGDKVRIVECRPLSRMKRWRLLSVDPKTTA